jgi:hypothetical protein
MALDIAIRALKPHPPRKATPHTSAPLPPQSQNAPPPKPQPQRYFETEAWNGIPGQWWFGGGTDITPNWVVEEVGAAWGERLTARAGRVALLGFPESTWLGQHATGPAQSQTKLLENRW